MNDKTGIFSSGLGRIMRNKRYIFWFWLLNLTLAEFGTQGFRNAAHAILDHSLYANNLTQGFHVGHDFRAITSASLHAATMLARRSSAALTPPTTPWPG